MIPQIKRGQKTGLLVALTFTVCTLLTGCSSDSRGVSSPAGQTTTVQDVPMTVLYPQTPPAADDTALIANTHGELSVPTYFTQIDGLYFIVDCYHDQVIYHDNLEDPIWQWNVMADGLSKPHTIAGDGDVYLVDDTDNHRLMVYNKVTDHFIATQCFDNVGNRPHYIQYDSRSGIFYVWSSMTGEMFLFERSEETADSPYHGVYLKEIRQIPELNGIYVRSFTIDGEDIYFVSGNSSIIKANLWDFTVTDRYPVPPELAGMIQLTRIQDMYYLTISTDSQGNQDYATIIRTASLSSLQDRNYEDIYDLFVGGGTPYYISRIGDVYYMTEHRIPGHFLWSFEIENNEIENVKAVY